MKLGIYKISNSDFLNQHRPQVVSKLGKSAKYDCDVLIWNNNYDFHSSMLKNFPKLKLLINWGTDDANLIDLVDLQKKVLIKRVDFYAQQSVCEYVLMLMVAFEHSQEKVFQGVRNHTRQLYGKKIGIIGLGKIGFSLARFLHTSFNCELFYNTTKDYLLPDYKYASKEDLIKVCDYVIIVAKSRTCKIDPGTLKCANPDLVIVNISKDRILPFSEISPYLRSHKIRGFIGDVTKSNPHKDVAKRVLIAPKIGYQTKEAKELKQNIALYYLKQFIMRESGRISYVYIARHGKTTWNAREIYQGVYDSPLTKDGRTEAMAVSEFIFGKGVRRIFSSPLGRAQETAKILAEKLNVPVFTIQSFTEMNFGVFQKKSQEQIKELFSDFFAHRSKNPHYKLLEPYPSGESYYDVYQRVLADVIKLLVAYDDFVIVGHESVNRMIRGIITGKNLTEMVNKSQKNNEVVEIEMSRNTENLVEL